MIYQTTQLNQETTAKCNNDADHRDFTSIVSIGTKHESGEGYSFLSEIPTDFFEDKEDFDGSK